MRISGDFFRKKRAVLKLIAVLAVLGLVGFGGFRVWAETRVGDFANNVKTTLSILDKVGNNEKTEFLSGEVATFSSWIEVTSEGDATSYPGAYLLLKFPKQYAPNRPTFVVTDIVSSQASEDTDSHYVQKFGYNNLAAGTIHSINSQFRLHNIEAPEGYSPEIVHELYSADGKLLSRQTKSIATKKARLNLTSYITSRTGSSNSQYIAKYTDATNTVIDKDSYPVLGKMEFELVPDVSYSPIGIGVRNLAETKHEYKVPPYMELAQESLDAGWIFDRNTRIATLTVDSRGLERPALQLIKLFYPANTDDSVINTSPTHEYNVTVKTVDGVVATSRSTTSINLRARRITDQGRTAVSKRSTLNSIYGRQVGDKFVHNILKQRRSGAEWELIFTVENDGNPTPVKVSSITDIAPEGMRFGVVSVMDQAILFAGDNANKSIKVILHKDDGTSIEAGQLAKNNTRLDVSNTPNIELYRRLELKFPDGYELPSFISGDKYQVRFYLTTDLLDLEKFTESLRFNDAPYTHINEAIFDIEEDELRASAQVHWEKQTIKIYNNIVGSNPLFAPKTYSTGERVYLHDNAMATTKEGYNNTYNQTYGINPNRLKNAKTMVLYSPGFSLSNEMKAAIGSGRVTYYENYKNTGKSALVDNSPDGYHSFGSLNTSLTSSFIVGELLLDGNHEFELITYWDDDDPNYSGTEGLDDLDFNDDGKPSRNIARYKTTVPIIKPEQVAIKKYVKTPGNEFGSSVNKLDPGQAVDYRISVINASDRSLLYSRTLEVLPKIGDKKIVEGNDGAQENRGSTTGVKMIGPITPREGFTISYSTDEPGANQNESWGKNFVSADRITDWSTVRMVKIEQNAGYQVPPQNIVNFIINAKIDENSKDASVANNTVAVAISSTGNLVESDPVRATVNFPIKIQGVAFMDNNRNSLFDDGVDTVLPNYKVEVLRGNVVVADIKTNDRGEYSYLTKEWDANFSVRFTRPSGVSDQAVLVPVRNSSNARANGSTPTAETNGVAVTPSVYLRENSNKVQNRNIGLQVPSGSVKVEHKYLTRTPDDVLFPMLKSSEIAVENANVNSNYDVRDKKKTEITDNNGLVYRFQSATGDPEVGRIKEGESVVTFLYEPKLGGPVKARFVNEQDEELKPEVVVEENQTQVGTPYTSTKENELTKNNLVYTFKQLKVNSASENGRVTENEQIITYVYAPKQGGSVKVRFVNEQGEELLTEAEIKPRGTQVGAEYASTKQNELQKNGLTYIFKELKNDSAPENGKVKVEDQVVTYVYAPKLGGSVIAKFVNQDGVSIQPDETIKAQQTQIGTRYTSNYPNEITANDGITYVFEKIVDGSAPREGQVNGDAQVITYRYIPKKGGAVTAEFVTKTGEKLKTDEVIKAADTPVGTQYASTKENELTKNNLVYTFESLKQGSAPENGKVKAEAQIVTYIYVPKLGGKVDAKFLDENGREIKPLENVSPDKTQVGTSYSSRPSTEITFENIVYAYKGLGQNSAPQNGRVSEGAQTISYIYTPKRGGSVIVNFVNEDGESIKDTQILKADGTPVGTAYEAQEDAEIEKGNLVYIFKELKDGSKPKTGRVSEDSTEVTFVYTPKPGGKVVAKFTTADRTELQDEEEVSPQDTQVGTEYASTKPEEIKKDGLVYIFKELKEDSAPEEGRVKSDAQTVNYIYEPKLGDAVSMRFIDTNGVLLGKIEEILPKGKQVGTPYEAKIPETITIDGKTYRLKIVRSDDGDAGEKGEVSENPQMITVIFEFVPPVETPNTGFNKSEDSFNPIIVIAGFAILAGASVAVVAKQKSSKK